MNPKPGICTSEFWLTLIGKALVFAVGVGMISQDKANEISSHLTALIGGVFAVVALWRMAAGYLESRTALKQAAASIAARGSASSVLPFLLAALVLSLAAIPAPAQLFGGWRTAILLDHERRISTLEGKASVQPAPATPAPIVLPAPATPTPQPATVQPIIITPPASPPATSSPAPVPMVFVLPGSGNPQPIAATGSNPQVISPTGPNPQVINPAGPNPQAIPATGSNPQQIPATGSNPQPIAPKTANPQPAPASGANPQPISAGATLLPGGGNPPTTPAPVPTGPMPPAASNPQVIPATSNSPGWRVVRYPSGQMVYYYQR